MTRLRLRELGRFPPGRDFLLVPRRPRRATHSALALYEAVEPRQRLVLLLGRVAAGAGLGLLLRPVEDPPTGLDLPWWLDWLEAVARPLVGPVERIAFRVPPNGRVGALLLDDSGHPIGFAKVLPGPPGSLEDRISRLLEGIRAPFRSPARLSQGEHDGLWFRLYEPMPRGAHHRPPNDPARIRAVIDAWQDATAGVSTPSPLEEGSVVCHGDFTPRNLRVAADGTWWLIDWDNARWGPRLADELHYWCAEYAWRLRPRPARDAQRVFRLLLQRGAAHEISAAAAWLDAPERTYREAERQMRVAVGRLAEGSTRVN